MNTRRIDGLLFEGMLKNGFAALQNKEKELNDLNVFPVPDGDTGTNMRLTLGNGISNAKSSVKLCDYMRKLSDGMLLGARGNSGVILSQLFAGMSSYLSRCGAASVGDMRNALTQGYRTAYSAVVKPKEGTILTVAREGIERIRASIDRNTSIETLLSMYLSQMKQSLGRTPELLPELKAAGVIDSGALGYITIVEGMFMYLQGEKINTEEKPVSAAPVVNAPNLNLFNANTSFVDGYCLEFILQLMKRGNYSQNFRLASYIDELKTMGTSIVAVQNGTRVKVHVHTMKPHGIIRMSQEFGEFLTFKLENMQLQHNERDERIGEEGIEKGLTVIAVSDCDKSSDILNGMGCGYTINAGPAMNVSVEDIVETIKCAHTEKVIVLPNNPNVIRTARQAANVFDQISVEVIDTISIPQGYFALAMDVRDSSDVDYRIRQIKSGANGVATLQVSVATKEYAEGDVSCVPGDSIALIDGRLAACADDSIGAFIKALKTIPDMDDRENIIVFRGAMESPFKDEKLKKAIDEAFEDMEITVLDGGSELYNYQAGVL